MMKFKFAAAAAAPVLALSLLAGSADAQSYRDAIIARTTPPRTPWSAPPSAASRAPFSATATAAMWPAAPLAGAAVGAASSNSRDDRYYGSGLRLQLRRGPDCGYFRDGRCYRNEGHWERDHGINSRDYDRDRGRYDRRDYRYDRRW
jgi:hypothetical protein